MGDWEYVWNPPSKEVERTSEMEDTREVVEAGHPGLEDPLVWHIIGLEVFPKLQRDAIRRRYRRRVQRIKRRLRQERILDRLARLLRQTLPPD